MTNHETEPPACITSYRVYVVELERNTVCGVIFKFMYLGLTGPEQLHLMLPLDHEFVPILRDRPGHDGFLDIRGVGRRFSSPGTYGVIENMVRWAVHAEPVKEFRVEERTRRAKKNRWLRWFSE